MEKSKIKFIISEILKNIKYDNDEEISKVDLNKICKKYNIGVCYSEDIDVTFLKINNKKVTKENLYGFIMFEHVTYDALIFISSKENYKKQRFILAHLLGHFFLNHNDGILKFDFAGTVNDDKEREANYFAENILMPNEKVIQRHDELLFPLVIMLAKEFDVSYTAMKYRLKNLKLKYMI